MATITIVNKPDSGKKGKAEINLDQWEKLADIFGMYRLEFLEQIDRSLKESRRGEVRKIKSLRELRT